MRKRLLKVILYFKATDSDHGSNGEITFMLMNTTVAEFRFDETTGELNSTSPFDYESSRNHFLLIFLAHDNGMEKRNISQTLEIVVQV